jgi:hypothetical protein
MSTKLKKFHFNVFYIEPNILIIFDGANNMCELPY